MTKSFSKTPRPWSIEDLYNRKAYMRAVPILVLEKWEREKGRPHADCMSTHEIHDELVARGLLVKPLSAQGAGNLVHGFRQKQEKRNLHPPFVEIPVDKGIWRFNVSYYEGLLREFSKRYPIMGKDVPTSVQPKRRAHIEKQVNTQPQLLVDKILKIVQEYEGDWQERLQDAEKRASATEQENGELREKLHQSNSVVREITDELLKKRIGALSKSPLDTMIREAGVILEDRLRARGGVGNDLEGVKLVDALLKENGKLVFSSHSGEQEGVRMLYRGAMQFIRNPPMHKLIEYKENTAILLIRLVDSLLQLLSEAELRQLD